MTTYSKNLIVNIDTNDSKSNNSNFNVISLNKWKYSKTNDFDLLDYGLTMFDVGATNKMHDSSQIKIDDDKLKLFRIGYNEVLNPTEDMVGPYTGITKYDGYEIEEVISEETNEKYFNLNGGYLQGFFGLEGFQFEILPKRYKNGVTIENLLYVGEESLGIFFMMGIRAEDKYNPHFSGETQSNKNTGVLTSAGEELNSLRDDWEYNKAFRNYEDLRKKIKRQPDNFENIENNVICFGLTENKNIFYKRIENGTIIYNESTNQITLTGSTLVSIVYTPHYEIDDEDLECHEIREGTLTFYVNGGLFWVVEKIPEPVFYGVKNDKTKQIGVPYSMSWGGGSFGLKHSYHYDFKTRFLFKDGDTTEIQNNFSIKDDNINLNDLDGFSLVSDDDTFFVSNEFNEDVSIPTIKCTYTGTTETSIKSAFILFNEPITTLSNRIYISKLLLYNDGFFKTDISGIPVLNKIKIVPFSLDQNNPMIIDKIGYMNPLLRRGDASMVEDDYLKPFPDKQEHIYIKDGVFYFGKTGVPITDKESYYLGNNEWYAQQESMKTRYVTGEKKWVEIEVKHKLKENVGENDVYFGILIESEEEFNINGSLFFTNFYYLAPDILVKDQNKENLFIEKNFNSSFIGGIQKLRIYDEALTREKIRVNAMNEKLSSYVGVGGRLIYMH